MSIPGRTWVSIGLVVISIATIINALQWPPEAANFPLTIATLLLIMATADVFLSLYLKKHAEKSGSMDFKMASAEDMDIDEATVKKRIYLILAWICLFFVMILLVGFPVAVPIFFIFFLRIYAKENWTITIIMTFIAWAFLYGLFIRLLHTPFDDGWIMDGLRAMGFFA